LVSPIELRYYLLSAHYRSNLEYSPEALTEAATAFKRLQSFLHRAGITGPSTGELDSNFAQAMNSDLATPQAIASLHQLATSGNSALASNDETSARNYAVQVQAGLAVLGCDPWAQNWQNVQTNVSEVEKALETLVESLLTERSKARESGDFTRADQIRDALTAAGVALEDSAIDTRWSVSPKNS
jgi:cysteinyl-tRNA synthetase